MYSDCLWDRAITDFRGVLISCLNDLISDKESIKKIMDYIKSNRETKIVPDIKRYYNN